MLLHFLTAAAIFMHATLGCCAHGSHEVGPVDDEPSSNCCCHCEHHHSPQDDLSEESPQPVPHECNHTDCEWPAPETRNPDDLFTLDLAGILPSTSTSTFAFPLGNGFNLSRLSSEASLPALPVRAHLANCVFLI